MSFQDPNCTIVITNIENREYSFRIKFEAMYCWQLVSMGDLPLPLDEFYSNNEPTTFQPFLANWLKDVSRRYEVCTIYSTEKFIIFSKCFFINIGNHGLCKQQKGPTITFLEWNVSSCPWLQALDWQVWNRGLWWLLFACSLEKEMNCIICNNYVKTMSKE